MDQPPPPSPPRPPDWLGRNWKWLVPALVLVSAVFLFGFFSLISGFMKSSDPCQMALARVRASPDAVAALGSPIAEGFFVMGNLHVSNSAGQAQFEIPLRAPKGKATLYVEAERAAGIWRLELLVVQLDASQQRIDLLGKKPPQ